MQASCGVDTQVPERGEDRRDLWPEGGRQTVYSTPRVKLSKARLSSVKWRRYSYLTYSGGLMRLFPDANPHKTYQVFP